MKVLSFMLLLLLIPICLRAQAPDESIKAVTVNGHPALIFPGTGQFSGHLSFSSVVERSGTDAAPVFLFHITNADGDKQYCPGLFTLDAERASWQPEPSPKCDKAAFDLPRTGTSVRMCCAKKEYPQSIDYVAIVQYGKGELWLKGDSGLRIDATHRAIDVEAAWSKPLFDFFYLAVKNIPAAEAEFWHLRGDFMTPGARAAFHEQAAAWRALAVKPELSEEVHKQSLLAESYLREKDFKGSIEHYELGVKACSTWPEGWFNLALLYGETGEFAQAADRMKHYLELMPNSPDASVARDKIVIWEDKAAKQ
jgi:hypothetical protein